MEYVEADFFEFMEDLPIYVDGSCFNGTVPELAAAGSAAIQLSADGQLLGGVCFTLPDGYPQTATYAEHMAAFIAMRRLPKNNVPFLVGDCNSVIRSSVDRKWAIGEDRPCAGVWTQTCLKIEVRKTKAHRTKNEAIAEGDLITWTGNDQADKWAKLAAQENVALEWEVERWESISKLALKLSLLLAGS